MREWTHVDDHNEAVHLILSKGAPGETYLIGSGDERNNKEILELILELMDEPADAYDHVPDRPGHDLRYSNDSTKIRTQLGWTPRYGDFRAGLEATIDWYRGNDWWWKPQKEATEARYTQLGALRGGVPYTPRVTRGSAKRSHSEEACSSPRPSSPPPRRSPSPLPPPTRPPTRWSPPPPSRRRSRRRTARVLYSAWDGKQYRLTQLGGDPIDVAGSSQAVRRRPRRRHSRSTPATASCSRTTSAPARSATCAPTGAVAGSLSAGRLVFATKRAIYRPRATGSTKRVAKKEALSLDSHNSRFTFSGSREWSHEPWLATQTSLKLLTKVPGGGASPDFFDTLNPTFSGNAIYWMLSRVGRAQPQRDPPLQPQARPRRARRRDDPGRGSGFAYDGGRAYYSLGTEIHEVTGLTFEKAPRIRMY